MVYPRCSNCAGDFFCSPPLLYFAVGKMIMFCWIIYFKFKDNIHDTQHAINREPNGKIYPFAGPGHHQFPRYYF